MLMKAKTHWKSIENYGRKSEIVLDQQTLKKIYENQIQFRLWFASEKNRIA